MDFASRILMCRPAAFAYNSETGITNSFQNNSDIQFVNEKACEEFDAVVELLMRSGIDVTVFPDTNKPVKPDAVFPNNWFTTHVDEKIILYPMHSANRRTEVRKDIIDQLASLYASPSVLDLTGFVSGEKFLEGTGSLVFHHGSKTCFAAQSPRTHPQLVKQVCDILGYRYFLFDAHDRTGFPVYHTNVVMCAGNGFCVACIECIVQKDEFREEIAKCGLELIEISVAEMESFAGNMIQLITADGEAFIVMSDTAFRKMDQLKLQLLSSYGKILHPAIPTIETIGGGSVRCMIAELFIP